LVCVEHAAEEVSCALHLARASLRGALGDHVTRGGELGAVGKTGVPNVHLHFAVTDRAEPNEPGAFAPLVTLPFTFSDYEVSNDFGASWQRVPQGVPSPGQWLRR
jgi:murein DD-endopeptidase MepM/ murein hydrolase activator NlpD